MIHIPAAEVGHFLLKLSTNRRFIRMGRILMLSLVAISALGCVGPWALGIDVDSPACAMKKCYSGGPLNLIGFISVLGAPKTLLIIPILDLAGAFLLLFKSRLTYLVLLFFWICSLMVILLNGYPIPNISYEKGNGLLMTLFSSMLLLLFSLTLAIGEAEFGTQTFIHDV